MCLYCFSPLASACNIIVEACSATAYRVHAAPGARAIDSGNPQAFMQLAMSIASWARMT
jgi:hypothetical protein